MYSPARKTSSPTIGLDFDDTISNPFMWARIVKILKATNCKVYIVTYRDKGGGWDHADIDAFQTMCTIDDVIFTSCQAKEQFCKSKDISIDIWIDDNPLAIVASLTPQGYTFETKGQ